MGADPGGAQAVVDGVTEALADDDASVHLWVSISLNPMRPTG